MQSSLSHIMLLSLYPINERLTKTDILSFVLLRIAGKDYYPSQKQNELNCICLDIFFLFIVCRQIVPELNSIFDSTFEPNHFVFSPVRMFPITSWKTGRFVTSPINDLIKMYFSTSSLFHFKKLRQQFVLSVQRCTGTTITR